MTLELPFALMSRQPPVPQGMRLVGCDLSSCGKALFLYSAEGEGSAIPSCVVICSEDAVWEVPFPMSLPSWPLCHLLPDHRVVVVGARSAYRGRETMT